MGRNSPVSSRKNEVFFLKLENMENKHVIGKNYVLFHGTSEINQTIYHVLYILVTWFILRHTNTSIIFYIELVLLGYFLLPQVVRTFREKGIPCDVVWMDIDYMDGFRCFTFDSVSTRSIVFATWEHFNH
jgi:hypothetical protein